MWQQRILEHNYLLGLQLPEQLPKLSADVQTCGPQA